MNNNTNHNFTDLFEQDENQGSHRHCDICKEFSKDSYSAFNDEEEETFTSLCENCYEEILAFENKFAKFLGTVKF